MFTKNMFNFTIISAVGSMTMLVLYFVIPWFI